MDETGHTVKLREEADELARAIDGEADDRVASEAADVLFHALVALVARGVSWRSVLAVLARLDERAALALSVAHEEVDARGDAEAEVDGDCVKLSLPERVPTKLALAA